MPICCCSLAGTTACDTCRNRPSDYARKKQMDKHYHDFLYEFDDESLGKYSEDEKDELLKILLRLCKDEYHYRTVSYANHYDGTDKIWKIRIR